MDMVRSKEDQRRREQAAGINTGRRILVLLTVKSGATDLLCYLLTGRRGVWVNVEFLTLLY